MEFLNLTFNACLRLQFLDVETNPGSLCPVPDVCRILCSDVRGLTWIVSDLTVVSSQYDLLLCSGTLDLDMCHVSVLLDPGFCCLDLYQGKMPLAQGIASSVRDGNGAFRQRKYWCSCCEILGFMVCGVRQSLYVFSLAHLDDMIFDCLLTLMAAI